MRAYRPCRRGRWRLGEREWRWRGKTTEYDTWGLQLVIDMELET
jgi:hypothetical protein